MGPPGNAGGRATSHVVGGPGTPIGSVQASLNAPFRLIPKPVQRESDAARQDLKRQLRSDSSLHAHGLGAAAMICSCAAQGAAEAMSAHRLIARRLVRKTRRRAVSRSAASMASKASDAASVSARRNAIAATQASPYSRLACQRALRGSRAVHAPRMRALRRRTARSAERRSVWRARCTGNEATFACAPRCRRMAAHGVDGYVPRAPTPAASRAQYVFKRRGVRRLRSDARGAFLQARAAAVAAVRQRVRHAAAQRRGVAAGDAGGDQGRRAAGPADVRRSLRCGARLASLREVR